MSPKTWLLLGGALAGALWAGNSIVGCVGDDPVPATDSGTGKPDTSTPVNPTGKADGETCATTTDCRSGLCVDGVCCESACNGKCEACNLPGKLGKCEPVAEGEDPANDCVTVPLPAADGGVIDDDAGPDAGGGLNLPEAGVTSDDKLCAGKCNGKRACAFPDKTKACGSTFCNSTSAQGRTSCDGQGHCLLGVEACDPYACPNGASSCKTTCTSPSDCASTHFCDATNTCKAKLGNGAVCQSPAQCQSGNCVDGVCCNDACQGVGGSCTQAGKVGQCTCAACATGACMLWYRDADNDTFGDMNGTVGNGNARAGCVTGPAPAPGFVKDNTDCDDGNANAKPGQSAYFTTPRANGSFDYDCSGTVTKETPEVVGGSCGYCETGVRLTCERNSKCTSVATTSTHSCAIVLGGIGGALSCKGVSQSAFRSGVACGDSDTLYTCGRCTIVGTVPGVSTSQRQQRCH